MSVLDPQINGICTDHNDSGIIEKSLKLIYMNYL